MPSTNDTKLKAFDFASDTIKQMIALATAVVTVTISFAKDVLGGLSNGTPTLLFGAGSQDVLGASWGFYLISVLFGIVTIMALTGQLRQPQPDPYRPTVTIPAILQSIAFFVGTVLIVVVGLAALDHHGTTSMTASKLFG
jgi:hypothetical protein